MRAWSSSRQTWGTSAVSSYIMETTQQIRSPQHWLRRRCQASFTKNGWSTPRKGEASLHGSFWISFAPDTLQCSMHRSLSTSHTLKSSSKPPLVQQKRMIKSQYSLHVGEQSAPVCKLCHKGNHLLQSCKDFRTQDSTSRYQTVQRLNHCFNCLSSEHRVRECPSKRNCRECGRRHHTMLHKTEMQTPTTTEPTATNNGTALTAAIPDHTAVIQTCQVLLETGGRTCAARAMLDSGSTLSFLTNRVATTLKAKKTPFVTAVTGLGQVPSVTSHPYTRST